MKAVLAVLVALALLPTVLAADTYSTVVLSCIPMDAKGSEIPGASRYVLERVFDSNGKPTALRLFTQPVDSAIPSSGYLALPLNAVTEEFSPHYSFTLRGAGVLITYTYGKKHDTTRISIHQKLVPELDTKGALTRGYRCR